MSAITPPTVLITGCSEGTIGHHLALSFSKQNYHVFAASRRLSSMESLKDMPNITLLELDVTSTASVQAAHDFVAATTGGTLDILYQNAGVRAVVMAAHSDKKLADWMMGTNFTAAVGMTNVFMPLLLKAGPGAKIVFTSSIGGRAPVPSNAVYSATKAALDMYADILRAEVAPLGMQVVSVVTGEVKTEMAVQTMEPLPEGMFLGSTSRCAIAQVLIFCIGSPYKPIEKIINDAWSERPGIMGVREYADVVVRQVIQKQPPHQIWAGRNSGLLWWLELFNLKWILPTVFSRQYGLIKLSP
jgi:1-acylglycerone phosphate reductase